jgi:hypothetical protein
VCLPRHPAVAYLFLVRSMTLAVFESWHGPPLRYFPYRWAWIVVGAFAVLCLVALAVLVARRQLGLCRYVILSALPLFLSLLLSVGLSWNVYLYYYGSYIYAGPPPEDLVVPAMFCSVLGLACSVVLFILFGVVLLLHPKRKAA